MSAVLSNLDGLRADTAAAAECFHCGLPVPAAGRWHVRVDGSERNMCCAGCQSVAEAIVANGLEDYYRTRTRLSATGDSAVLVPQELRAFQACDRPEFWQEFETQCRTPDHACEATLSIEGVRCGACVWLIERRLASMAGVLQAHMNAATEKLQVRWDPDLCQAGDILRGIRAVGYRAFPYDAARHEAQLRRAAKRLFRQLFVAGLAMMQVMMYAVPAYLADDGTLDADTASLLRWASLVLTLPAVAYSALPFFTGALANLRQRMLGMDVPVALGIGAAFAASAVATWRGRGDVYFDSVTMFIFLLLCSRYLELTARRKAASALEQLQHALPAVAQRLAGYPADRSMEAVAAAQLRVGDILLVRPGEAVAADGVIVEGETEIDIALLTGESRLQARAVGDALPSGAVNAAQAVVMRVDKPAGDSTLSMLIKLIERAGQAKPRLALWADQVAAWFVCALLLFALAVFAFWLWRDAARAWPIAIAVLVVSCPCALSLAMPTALAVAADRLLKQGVLVVQPHVLETLHRATHVIFDKTGTLTAGKPQILQTRVSGKLDQAACLRVAAALEQPSAHPLARAFITAARYLPASKPMRVQHIGAASGRGMEGIVDGVRYRLGSDAFVGELSGTIADAGAAQASAIYLGSKGACLARFDVADALRSDAREVVARFRAMGKQVILLSGDRKQAALEAASALGIETAYGEQLPDQKLAYVRQLQRVGAVVAMVGDGINDAAVLRAADVSFAMGSGAALAQTHADAVLLSARLSSLADTAEVADRCMQVIRQNLAWATLYNAVAIPAAACGLLNPWFSAIGMSASSAVVVVNALRLRRRAAAGGAAPALQATRA